MENWKVRFVHLQYKTWDTNTLYFTQGNLIEQINKLDTNLCQSGMCVSVNGNKNSRNYRFPFCSAFLRPTSNLIKPDSTLVSTGIHIPICMVKKIQLKDKKVDKKNSKGKSIEHNIFEELFIENHIGSQVISDETRENLGTVLTAFEQRFGTYDSTLPSAQEQYGNAIEGKNRQPQGSTE